MSIEQNLNQIKANLPQHVTLVAVSKTKPQQDILAAYSAGQRIFGENKIQEMCDKQAELPDDIQWHMIGHVQRNKVKYMASFVSLIHGVDNFRLLKEINKQAQANNRVIDCLLQVFIAEEQTKFGLDQQEVMEILSSQEFAQLHNIRIVGVMGMATFTEDQAKIKGEFDHLKQIFDQAKQQFDNLPNVALEQVSMGMSNDYNIAIESGSTMIRVGSSIFGNRNY